MSCFLNGGGRLYVRSRSIAHGASEGRAGSSNAVGGDGVVDRSGGETNGVSKTAGTGWSPCAMDQLVKPGTAAAWNMRKLAGLAEWLRNHLVGADGAYPDHRRTLRRPFSES